MSDFKMNKDKPVNNNGGSHCAGDHDEVFNGVRQTPNANWRPDDDCMTKAIANEPWKPQGMPKRGT